VNFQFTNPVWLWLALPALAWTVWFFWKSDAQISGWRRGASLFIRLVVVLLLLLALGGLQWLKPLEGMNVFFLLDRSDSVPTTQQESSREFVNQTAATKDLRDKAGVVVFGTDAAVEFLPNPAVQVQKIQAVVPTERTDIAAAIRLATAAFPENGQRRLVLATDGNENIGDAMSALLAARPLGVTLDVLPLGVSRANDVAVQRLAMPSALKKGQTFDVKIFATADRPGPAKLRLYRSDQLLGEQEVELTAGKNLLSFPQTLNDPGFYNYEVQIEAPGDRIPQNNQASGFAFVRGEPRTLIVTSDPQGEKALDEALRASKLETRVVPVSGFPASLAEMQSFDSIFLCNVSAGDLGLDRMRLLESAVRDFGVGLVAIGGDQAFAAGGYRNTPLEAALPVDMELNSKKVLPKGALALVVHATEFPDGNQWARETAYAALDALGPLDEMGIVFWDGSDRWLFDLQPVGNKKELGRQIMGMNPGDMPSFMNVMKMAHDGLKKSTANIKHMVVFSDGDPAAPTQAQVDAIIADRITISTVMIGGHVQPDAMMWMADKGGGRFYDVRQPSDLPQIFVKEAAVILKSAIFEEPFKPQVAAASELTRGLGGDFPTLYGYVCTSPKTRAETPLLTEKGDPLLAHWQFGLGRSVAFTSDAKAKWAKDWIAWDRYRQFWSQIAQWSLRRVDNADFTTDVTIDRGEAVVAVEAIDNDGNYRNFLNLQTTVVSPKGQKQLVRLEQTGPGRYEARFPTKEIGAYMMNVAELKDGKVRASQALGASVNYSPEFASTEPNLNLLRRLAEAGGGKILDPSVDNPFKLGRTKTFQPEDWWEQCLKLAILLFVLDVAIRRILLDREELKRGWVKIRSKLPFGGPVRQPVGDPAMDALRQRRDAVRARNQAKATEGSPVISMPKPSAEDFTRLTTPTKPASTDKPADPSAPSTGQPSANPTDPKKPAAGAESTTSRLLDAKRRANRDKK
jgi:uncharacterized membrane protein/Mg-chelatase subunit ChlD